MRKNAAQTVAYFCVYRNAYIKFIMCARVGRASECIYGLIYIVTFI